MFSERIDQDQLLIAGKQRLVTMGTMQIDQAVPNLFEDPECRLRSVNELPVRARNREDALQEKLTIFARVDSLPAEHLIHFREVIQFKQRFHWPLGGPGSNQ